MLREGAIAAGLTALMILLFLGSWRSTLIIALSIPLSVLSSLAVLSALGETINLMTLGGLALAVGILVDDATVTIENINRHLEEGGEVVQETRLYDPDKNVTRSLRSKEDAHDYRYFPDPDLLPLELDDAFLEECRATLPELPDAKRKRYEGLGITPYNASVLTAEVETARWFDALLDAGAEPKQAANWVVAELFGALNRRGESIEQSPVSPAQAAELLGLVADGTISGTIAKQVFEIMLETGQGASAIVEERGLKQTSDTGAIDAEVDKVLAANADKVAEYKAGKPQLFGFFVGQVMKAMAGKANPQLVNERLRAKLG